MTFSKYLKAFYCEVGAALDTKNIAMYKQKKICLPEEWGWQALTKWVTCMLDDDMCHEGRESRVYVEKGGWGTC